VGPEIWQKILNNPGLQPTSVSAQAPSISIDSTAATWPSTGSNELGYVTPQARRKAAARPDGRTLLRLRAAHRVPRPQGRAARPLVVEVRQRHVAGSRFSMRSIEEVFLKLTSPGSVAN
jgi:hypothetical protein